MLNYGFNFSDFNSLSGLQKLDEKFLAFVKEYSPNLQERLIIYRQLGENKLPTLDYANFLIELAPILDDFIADLFNIKSQIQQVKEDAKQFDVIYEARRQFVQKYAIKKYPQLDINIFKQAEKYLISKIGGVTEEKLSRAILDWQENSSVFEQELNYAAQYCAFKYHQHSLVELFNLPRKINSKYQIRSYRIDQLREKLRFGFDYRDPISPINAIMQSKYCLYCHKQGKDSCSKGFIKTKVKNQQQRTKDGCPLRQKISEMNLLKNMGFNIGALAVIIIDNPMVAATGHRICNDCMQCCIFQKQEAVDIPTIETSILEQILAFSWGVEIYLLLTKWNPLNINAPLPGNNSGYNILVAGTGAAGFTISHYLLNEGHNVTLIDGLTISPLEFDIQQPIENWQDLKISLSKRHSQGFGGIAEYGITNRWDKNNLTLIRLILERRENFYLQSAVRIGSTITTKQAFELGFDHIVLCVGAGKPNYLPKTSYFSPAIRSAADFLMNLQQLTPYQHKQNDLLQIRLPVLIIGGGLTSVDSAVEIMHYYPEQVANFAKNYRAGAYTSLTQEKKLLAAEYLAHAASLEKAKNAQEKLALLQKFGGVTILYRQTITNSPAYKLNPEEIESALATGVKFLDKQEIKKINFNQAKQLESVLLVNEQLIPAKTILLATGTNNNEFIDLMEAGEINSSIFKNQAKTISHLGDCNPLYAGSIVKALASAKDNYQSISANLNKSPPKLATRPIITTPTTITAINNLTKDIFLVEIYSKTNFANYQAGQFYKLQKITKSTNKALKPIAITPIQFDQANHLIKFVIKTNNKKAHLLSLLKPGEEISLMGPAGSAIKLPSGKNILFIGYDLGTSLLLPIIEKSKAKNNRNHLISIYKSAANIILEAEINYLTNSSSKFFLHEEINQEKTILKQLGKLIKQYNFDNSIDYIYCNVPTSLVEPLSELKSAFIKEVKITCNISSAMHCMMKGICGQCIQKLCGQAGYIFACTNQYIDSELLDLKIMQNRTKSYF